MEEQLTLAKLWFFDKARLEFHGLGKALLC
jgi:hypothetical protein